jgi:phenylacetate-CoA ligase
VLTSSVYLRLPTVLRFAVASLRGYQLQRRRYGPHTEGLVEQALERERWTSAEWRRWTEGRLEAVLHHARTRVPFYRAHWDERRRRGDRSSPEILQNWPILSKRTLRENADALLSEPAPGDLFEAYTSGTTGTPLRVWQSLETLRAWYALVEARVRRWNGVRLSDRWAQMGGQVVTPIGRRRPPFWVWNRGMRQLYLSSYHVAPSAVGDYVEAMRRYEVRYLFGYPSAMQALAREILEQGFEAPKLEVAIGNAEPLLGYQRAAISRAFRCSIRDTYGQAEIVCGASECSAGSMHLWPEIGVTEWMRDDADEAVAEGQTGRMICTALLSTEMPLIRYAIGDRSALSSNSQPCVCGRSLPRISAFEGRTADLMLAEDGTSVGVLDTIFEIDMPIREAQIIQESLHSIRIKVVPGQGFGDRHRHKLARGIRMRMGPNVEVPIETVAAIPRTKAGKFRVQVCMLNGDGGGERS